jgi:TP901 family phage tail tape measure protein
MPADYVVATVLEAHTGRYKRDMNDAAATTDKFGNTVDKTSKSATASMEEINRASTQVGLGLTALGTVIIGGFAASAKAAIDFESSFAGVRKTVDASESQLLALSDGFRDLAKEIPISVHELNGIGEAASQLGIETKNILGFTRTMADLGVATNLTADQAATAFARFANITQMPQTQFDRLGSTVVALGNNLATTEGEISDFALRLAGAGAQVGLTEAEILGLGGALSSVGINAEAGGTAVSKVMIDMASAVSSGGDELAQFATVAGMSSERFAAAFRDDAAGAIVAFIEGLGQVDAAGGDLFATLEALGVTEQRMRDALLRTAGAGTLVADAMGLANDAWGDNTALTIEAAQRYETLESRIQLAKNAIGDAAISLGQTLTPAIGAAVDGVADVAAGFADLPGPIQAAAAATGGLVGVTSLAAGGFLLLAPRIVETRKAIQTLQTTVAGGRIIGALGSMGSLLAGPWGLAVAGATLAIGQYAQQQGEARQRIEDVTATLDEQTGAITENTRAHVANRLEQQGARDAAHELGLSFQTVVDAAMGSAEAQRILALRTTEVQAATSAELEGLQNVGRSMQGAAHDGGVLSERQRELAQALGIVTRAVSDEAAVVAEATAAKREDALVLAESEGRYLDFAHAIDAGVDPALARLADSHAMTLRATQDGTAGADGFTDTLADQADQVDDITRSLGELADALRAQTDPVFAASKSLRDLDEMLKSTDASAEDVATQALRTQSDLLTLAGAIDDGTTSVSGIEGQFRMLVDQGMIPPEMAADVLARLKEVVRIAEETGVSVTEALNLHDEMRETGRRSGEGYVIGLDSTLAMARRKGAELGHEVANATALALRIRSPSRVFYEFGQSTVTGCLTVIDDGTDLAHEVEALLNGTHVTDAREPAEVPA